MVFSLNYFIIDSRDKIIDFLSWAKEQPLKEICIDAETDSSNEKLAKLYGIGIALEEHEGFYIPIRRKDGSLVWSEQQLEALKEAIKKLCAGRQLIGWNISYDINVFINNGFPDLTKHLWADGILAKALSDEERPHGLKEVAVKYLGEGSDAAQQELYANIRQNGGKVTEDVIEMFKADTEVLGKYCVHDCCLSLILWHKFEAKIKSEGMWELFLQETMELYRKVTIPMKQRGFPVNVDHFSNLKQEIEFQIAKLEDNIQQEIMPLVKEYTDNLLLEEFPSKKKGNFPKAMALVMCGQEPESLSKNKIEKWAIENGASLWLEWTKVEMHNDPIVLEYEDKARRVLWDKKYPNSKYVFNLGSNNHLRYLFFTKLGVKPTEFTETGEPKLSADVLEELSGQHPIADTIIDYKKLNKLLSTYVDGILSRQVDGILYPGWLQFGTTSGRYSCTGPNLQNQPRVKDEDSNLSPLVLKYTNEIKRGFVAPKGYKIVNADYSQLEPCGFASACGDADLQDIFKKKQDLYSAIAIRSNNLEKEFSADKKSPNYLKNKRPELRQVYKVVALAAVYGAEAFRIAQILDISPEEAQDILDKYFTAYPGLMKYIRECHWQAKKYGRAISRFGRVRHLESCMGIYKKYGDKILDHKYARQNGLMDIRRAFKSNLNLACNHPIQSLAAHIVNRASIAIADTFTERGIDGYICAQVHDEITTIVREDQAQEAADIIKYCMENTTLIEVPLSTDPLIADNWAEAK